MKIIFAPELEASRWRHDDDDWAAGLIARKAATGDYEHFGDICDVPDRVGS